MALPLVLMASGTALQLYGGYMANMAQAQSEMQNAKFYQRQAEFAQEATFRETELARRNYSRTKGIQASAFAKGGVDLSGSAGYVLAGTYAREIEELSAIKIKGKLEYDLARLRGVQSQEKGQLLGSAGYNLVQGGSTILTSAGQYYAAKGAA